MKTPTDRECSFFYGDYYRGRNFEECRGLVNPKDKLIWHSGLCKDCPVPNIQRNNNCPNLVLSTYIGKTWFKKRMKVESSCSKTLERVKDPNIGCGHCHEIHYL